MVLCHTRSITAPHITVFSFQTQAYCVQFPAIRRTDALFCCVAVVVNDGVVALRCTGAAILVGVRDVLLLSRPYADIF